jgi:mannosyl-oligosaccharide alpha-1,3-glucosidase
MLLGKSVAGISNCGADVGGFEGNPTDELHVRWYQVGTLSPFFRGHSKKWTDRREPWLFKEKTKNLIKETIMLRYELLPYWYTEFYKNTLSGFPILRPLWFEFPTLVEIFKEESQYLIGDSLLACPVLSENQKR